VIKFLYLKGNTPTQIKTELDTIYGDSTPSFVTIKRLAAEFKHDRTTLADYNKSSERLTIATIIDNIKKIHQIVLDDCRIKVRQQRLWAYQKIVFIINRKIKYALTAGNWVSCLLIVDQKCIRNFCAD